MSAPANKSLGLKAVQIAYHVPDVRAAAVRMAAETGAGPFFLAEHIPLEACIYRGQEIHFDHSSAYGQMGNVMVELFQQHNDGPSAVRDMYRPEDEGLHHVACFVEDLAAATEHYEALGFPLAQAASTAVGVDFNFMDARNRLGHMIELYEPSAILTGLYDMVREAASDWDGRDPLRALGG